MQLRRRRISALCRRTVSCVSVAVFTVADGAHGVVVVHALADDPPLCEHRVGADGAHVKCAPGSQQVICADVTLAASDGKVPVGQGEGGVAQHVLRRLEKGKKENVQGRFLCKITAFRIFFYL